MDSLEHNLKGMNKFIVYGLVDPMTHQLRYIGKSERGLARPAQHSMPSKLGKDKTHKGNWVRSLVAQGLRPEVVVVQELPSKDILRDAETFWIAYFKSMGCPLTNHCRGGTGFTGKHTEESKKKMSVASKGRRHSEESKQKMSAALRGHKVSDETKVKISVALLGRPGHKHTDEARAKISTSHQGLKASPEARAKMSTSAKARPGHKQTDETRTKISMSRRGLRVSPEARAKMSASAKARWALEAQGG